MPTCEAEPSRSAMRKAWRLAAVPGAGAPGFAAERPLSTISRKATCTQALSRRRSASVASNCHSYTLRITIPILQVRRSALGDDEWPGLVRPSKPWLRKVDAGPGEGRGHRGCRDAWGGSVGTAATTPRLSGDRGKPTRDARRTDVPNPSRSCWGHRDRLLSLEGIPQNATCGNIPALGTDHLESHTRIPGPSHAGRRSRPSQAGWTPETRKGPSAPGRLAGSAPSGSGLPCLRSSEADPLREDSGPPGSGWMVPLAFPGQTGRERHAAVQSGLPRARGASGGDAASSGIQRPGVEPSPTTS